MQKKSGSLCYCDIVAINGHQGGPWSDPQCGRVRSTHGNGELRLVSYEREKRGPKAAAFIYFFNFGSLYRLYANGYICFFFLLRAYNTSKQKRMKTMGVVARRRVV